MRIGDRLIAAMPADDFDSCRVAITRRVYFIGRPSEDRGRKLNEMQNALKKSRKAENSRP